MGGVKTRLQSSRQRQGTKWSCGGNPEDTIHEDTGHELPHLALRKLGQYLSHYPLHWCHCVRWNLVPSSAAHLPVVGREAGWKATVNRNRKGE